MSEFIEEVVKDTLMDVVKLLPFLLIAFLIIELIEHKFNKKSKKIISKSGKLGPFFGSLLGLFPQCGFGVMATNLYVTRVISVGTLIAVYLSTSDEMIPVLLSGKADPLTIIKILAVKFIVGMTVGFIIDFLLRNVNKSEKFDYHLCNDEHCHCENGIIKSAVKHTLSTILFITIAIFLLNTLVFFVGENNISKIFLKDSIFSPFIASLLGLFPNCAASVIISELYLEGAISVGSLIAGLLTGSGVAILLLFKSNKNLKDNLFILITIYLVGAFSGFGIELIKLLIK